MALRLAQFWYVVATTGMVTTGCVRFDPKPVVPAETAAAFESRSLTDSGLKAYLQKNAGQELTSWPPESWDASLLTLVAFYYHPDMDMARAKWGTARAAEVTAGESPNPTLAVTPGYNATTNGISPWIITGTFDLPIETANKRGYRLAQARHDADAARANIVTVAWQTRTRLRRALVDYVGGTRAAEILRRQQSSQERTVQMLELQLQQPNANVSPNQVTQARIALRNTRLAVMEAERQSEEAQARLADALGLPLAAIRGAPVSLELATDLPSGIGNDDARRQAVLGRADVIGGLADYAASQSALQLEIAKQYPDLHLGPGYEFDQGDSKWSLGASLTLPIFNQNRGAISEARARRTEAAIRFSSLQAKVIGEIDTAVANYAAARRKLEMANELRGDIEKQRKAGEALLQAGEISRLELIGLELELQTSEQANLDATVKAHQAMNDVEGALQRPLDVAESAVLNRPRREGVAGNYRSQQTSAK